MASSSSYDQQQSPGSPADLAGVAGAVAAVEQYTKSHQHAHQETPSGSISNNSSGFPISPPASHSLPPPAALQSPPAPMQQREAEMPLPPIPAPAPAPAAPIPAAAATPMTPSSVQHSPLNGAAAGPAAGAGAGAGAAAAAVGGAPFTPSRASAQAPLAPAHASASTTTAHAVDGQRMQLIDETQAFHADLAAYLRQWRLHDVGFGYDLVAVLGSQSTGKSTLLNRLFGTTFDVMDESQRRQTTKGIWLSRASASVVSPNAQTTGAAPPVLVMDVEGTDGRERGEDQDFERKSALFSMASAEVLLVNMWEHQVGLYQGANMGLLKTVFEVNLALFQSAKHSSASPASASAPKEKTLLFFVIRDHIGATPLANLRNTLLADLGRIWASLAKPDGLAAAPITDFFDFDFAALPHKLLQPEAFDAAVVALRSRFLDAHSRPSHEGEGGYVFKPQYHKRIPADGLPHYLSTVWEQVVSNKDLDLPTQQELLAQFRCDEIATLAFGAFAARVKPFRKPIEAGEILDALAAGMGDARAEALRAFDKDASRYHAQVYQRKRAELLDKLHAALSPLVLGQLKNLHRAVLARFKAGLLDKLRGEAGAYDFGAVVRAARAEAEGAFALAAAALVLEGTDWSTAEEEAQLRAELDAVADACRAEETKKTVVAIERAVRKRVAEPTEVALAKPGPLMWDQVLQAFDQAWKEAQSTYLRKAKSESGSTRHCHSRWMEVDWSSHNDITTTTTAADRDEQASTAPRRRSRWRRARSRSAPGPRSGPRSTSRRPTRCSPRASATSSRTASATTSTARRASGARKTTSTPSSARLAMR